MLETWRVIRSGFLSGAENMALDEALLESQIAGDSPPVLRLYRWAPPTVTLGYGQRGDRVVNLAACRELGYDVVRRCTGGRAVLHDVEMTYAVVARSAGGCFRGGILENYRVIAEVLQATLAKLGLASQLSLTRSAGLAGEGAERSACFVAPGQFELVCDGRKLAGCAQKRQGDCFLQHGSVPVEIDLERLFRALTTDPKADIRTGAEQLSRHVGWVNRWLARPVSVAQVEEAFLEQFESLFGVGLVTSEPTPAERARADFLGRERYANPAWNLRGLASRL